MFEIWTNLIFRQIDRLSIEVCKQIFDNCYKCIVLSNNNYVNYAILPTVSSAAVLEIAKLLFAKIAFQRNGRLFLFSLDNVIMKCRTILFL